MAALYERSHAAAAAVATAHARVRRLLLSKVGVPSSSDDEVLLAAFTARRQGIDASTATTLLRRATVAARDPELHDIEAIALVRELHQLEKAIEGTRQVFRIASREESNR
jgi:hypothetical protein